MGVIQVTHSEKHIIFATKKPTLAGFFSRIYEPFTIIVRSFES